MCWEIKVPASTPIRDESTSAQADPIKMCQMEFDFEASSIVESWVLSPNSARKTRMNVDRTDFHIVCTPK